jgi:hypothetical protein
MSINVHDIIAFEMGELDFAETVTLFSRLVSTGEVWHLQGFYGRTAHALIEGGYLDPSGRILQA